MNNKLYFKTTSSILPGTLQSDSVTVIKIVINADYLGFFLISYNVQSIADGGALYHRSLIEKQMLKICKQIN
jgi:hypothetical protein